MSEWRAANGEWRMKDAARSSLFAIRYSLMFQTFGKRHIVRQLLGRQSNYLIAFDQFLLLVWSIAPPTSVISGAGLLEMFDSYAGGRSFFADDPKTTIAAYGLRKEDFTVHARRRAAARD